MTDLCHSEEAKRLWESRRRKLNPHPQGLTRFDKQDAVGIVIKSTDRRVACLFLPKRIKYTLLRNKEYSYTMRSYR